MLLNKDGKKQIALLIITSAVALQGFANDASSYQMYSDINHASYKHLRMDTPRQEPVFFANYLPANPDIELQLGGFNASQGRSQDVGINGLIGDHFSVTRRNDQNVLVGLGYFLTGFNQDQYKLMYGLNAFYLASTDVKGNVIQEQTFTNLSYRYSVTNYPIYLAAKGLINFNNNNQYNLTFDVGIGPNVIQANGFDESSLDGGITIPDHPFNSNTEVAFSATAGVGIKFNNALGCLPLEIDYRFFYLGEGHLTNASSQVLNNLKTGHSYANALFISVAV